MADEEKKSYVWNVKLKSRDEIEPFVKHVEKEKGIAPTREPVTMGSKLLEATDLLMKVDNGQVLVIDLESNEEAIEKVQKILEERKQNEVHDKTGGFPPSHNKDKISASLDIMFA
jgi:hypothetical protein